MSDDEYRPTPAAPAWRRTLRLDVQRPEGDVGITVEDPQLPEEVQMFERLARDVLGLQIRPRVAPFLPSGASSLSRPDGTGDDMDDYQ